MGDTVIGCIGLGVMGEPICANLMRKSGSRVRGFDLRAEPLSRLAEQGLERAATAEDAARDAAVVFLSLPGGPELAEVGTRLQGAMRPGTVLVDLSTAPVDLTRELAARFAASGRGLRRCPGRPHPPRRRAGRALRDGRGRCRDLRAHRALPALLRQRRAALRSGSAAARSRSS